MKEHAIVTEEMNRLDHDEGILILSESQLKEVGGGAKSEIKDDPLGGNG
jgi:hypothetical protein